MTPSSHPPDGRFLGDSGLLTRARALGGAGRLAWYELDLVTARARLEESLALFRQARDPIGTVEAISSLILVLSWQGESAAALALLREAMELQRRLTDRQGRLPVLAGLGWAASFMSAAESQDDAWAINEEVAALARAADDTRSLAWAQDNLGMICYWRTDLAAARPLLEEGLALFRQSGELFGVAHCAWGLGNVAREEGRYEESRTLNDESLALVLQTKTWAGLPYCLESAARLAMIGDEPRRAARLLAAADRARETQRSFAQPLVRAERERWIPVLRTMLSAEEWEAARAEGRAMTPDSAVAYAIGGDTTGAEARNR